MLYLQIMVFVKFTKKHLHVRDTFLHYTIPRAFLRLLIVLLYHALAIISLAFLITLAVRVEI